MSNKIEYEAKFLEVDVKAMREKLKSIGAKLDHERTKYVRAVFHRCTDDVKGYARIRDEAGKTTMTVKLYKDPKFPEEYEVSINEDFKTGLSFLTSLGVQQKAYQETFREKWNHELAHEITFDSIPGIPTYMEIDCTSEEKLNELINLLDLNKDTMRFGAFDEQYFEYYGIAKDEFNNHTPSITFENIINEIKPNKNLDLLKDMQEQYKQFNNIVGGWKN